jgi:hypothetical protein
VDRVQQLHLPLLHPEVDSVDPVQQPLLLLPLLLMGVSAVNVHPPLISSLIKIHYTRMNDRFSV